MNGFQKHISHPLASSLDSPPPWIVGILNLTPDSFSDGGLYASKVEALTKGRLLLQEGAHILEIGGESTGPGSKPIDLKEELRRILPAVTTLAKEAFVSVDTYKASTAARCLEAGARMINDVSALRADESMLQVVSEHGAYLCLMYNKEPVLPHVTKATVQYKNVVQDVADFLLRRIDLALSAGIKEEKLVADPGMGHFLSYGEDRYSWELLRNLEMLQKAGVNVPIMIGTSRKSLLGGPLNSRDPASALTSLLAIRKGASLVRVHNVGMMREFIEIEGNGGAGL